MILYSKTGVKIYILIDRDKKINKVSQTDKYPVKLDLWQRYAPPPIQKSALQGCSQWTPGATAFALPGVRFQGTLAQKYQKEIQLRYHIIAQLVIMSNLQFTILNLGGYIFFLLLAYANQVSSAKNGNCNKILYHKHYYIYILHSVLQF